MPAVPGASAAAGQPSACYLARSPAVAVLALDRIRPRVRQWLVIHRSIRMPGRTESKAESKAGSAARTACLKKGGSSVKPPGSAVAHGSPPVR